MKKYLLLLCMFITATAVHAEFNRLLFRTLEGKEQSVGLAGLNISFSNGELIAISEGESVEIPLASLKSMEFSNDKSGIPDVIAGTESGGKVSVYNAEGHFYGLYESVTSACAQLPGGVYILKTENGITSKIMINR